MKTLLFFLFGTVIAYSQCDSSIIFAEETDNAVCIEVVNNVRYVYANNIPDHGTGSLNGGFTLTALDDTWTMCAEPELGSGITQLYGDDSQMGCSTTGSFKFGVGTNGVHYAPSSTDYFTNTSTSESNYDWNIEAVSAFGVNNQGAHLNPSGEYHYHAIASIYFNSSLGIDGSAFSPIVGYAADGYPMYYKYAYTDANDSSSGISAFDAGWQLKTGNRSDDGITDNDGVSSPDGTYDGYYVEDYEFISASTELDECNGRFGITPDYPSGTYYYVLTDSWPYIPRCFAGAHVDESFLIGPSAVCPDSTADTSCPSVTLGVTDFNEMTKISIYPNPTSDYLEVTIPPGLNGNDISITLLNNIGQEIKKVNNNTTRLDLSNIPTGTYYLNVKYFSNEYTKKIIRN